ncbi:dienelactone hydrolase [Coprinopsis cinerea okayama7|uniref:Dienelactone hydrolase n=1 Tax=Coprinopsis cinerea (strain Okayama-7 / 130 / ATCC MYA-4618 / FGSC 9003) TaxID=240176 RepID=A8NY96_COPC7|nr:dienelactone hydrolase [Coprinopsis cinerea okayama7\|eukprot:XP_001837376.2 dienelactone hydrolase [Coprinopsis cinerea okayama7\
MLTGSGPFQTGRAVRRVQAAWTEGLSWLTVEGQSSRGSGYGNAISLGSPERRLLDLDQMGAPAFYDPNSPDEQPVALPNAPIRRINDHIGLQPPLSRRGHGPGVLLFLNSTKGVERSPKPLDPGPVQKWAEEGFAVAFTTGIPSGSTVQKLLTEAENAFRESPEIVDIQNKFAVIGSPDASHLTKPTLLHTRQDETVKITNELVQKHSYPVASGTFVLPTSADYDPGSASVAHTRSLVFLRKHLGGPHFDLEAIWDEHCYFEFEARSVAKTMATMVAEPYVNHVPTMTGGVGRENLTRFYRDHFIFSCVSPLDSQTHESVYGAVRNRNPADARLQVISRTVGPDRVYLMLIADEFIYHITHDRTVDWLLPQVPPTGKKLAIPMMAVVNIRGDRLYNEHIWWDQATALMQCGILPTHLPYPTPEGQPKMTIRIPAAGVETANMLVDETQGKSNEMLGEGWGLIKHAD